MRHPTRVASAFKSSLSKSALPATRKFTPKSVSPTLFDERDTVYRNRRIFKGVQLLLCKKPHDRNDRHRKTPLRSPRASMFNWLQVLSTPTADTPGSLLVLHHDNRRYLLGNISEGTQRLMVQRKVSLARVEEIFLTGPTTWHGLGGLLGMVLTIADIVQASQAGLALAAAARKSGGAPAKPLVGKTTTALGVHGAENLTHTLATARRFIFRKGLPLKPHELRTDPRATDKEGSDPDWQDSNIGVWYVPIQSAGEVSRPPSRKRSHDAIDGSEPIGEGERLGGDQALLDSIVTNMFESAWSMDALVETTLHQVQLPAKLFVRDENGHLIAYDGPTDDVTSLPDIPVLVRQPWPATQILSLPPTAPSRQAMCYIVKNHPRRGRFRSEEATRLGVPVKERAALTKGQSVVGKDGIIVTPDMVMEPAISGKGFAVVEIPEASYIDAFLARPEWTNSQICDGIEAIYWLLGPGLVNDARILDFMRERSKMRHTVSSPDTCPNMLTLGSPSAIQIKLHRLDPERFPLHQHDNNVSRQPDVSATPFVTARPGATMNLAPDVSYRDDLVLPFVDTMAPLQELDEKTVQLADAARAKISDVDFLAHLEELDRDIPNRDAEIIPLGTGSAMPSKYRNVSATLVRVPGFGAYLFDCGENTLGSMHRLFGFEETAKILKELRAIWISHLHADHHLGTVSVIRAWRDATASDPSTRDARLAVASHVNMIQWLREYAGVEDFGLGRLRLIELWVPDNSPDHIREPFLFPESTEADEFGITRIDVARVDHCYGALACVFSWPTGLKIAYSGDCRPSDAFVQIGQGATLLIHESTFDNELGGEAEAKKHSTMAEAIDVGRRMGARKVLLTHFSQRYPKIPVFDAEEHGGEKGHAKDMTVLMAFDQMRVKLGDFKKAAAFLPALQKLFEEPEVAEQDVVQDVPPIPKSSKQKGKKEGKTPRKGDAGTESAMPAAA